MKVIDEHLLTYFRAKPRCEWCGRPAQCQPHHIFSRGMGGGSRLDVKENLIALCHDCHQAHHDGHRPIRCDLLAVVSAREKRTQGDIENYIHSLIRLPKGTTI